MLGLHLGMAGRIALDEEPAPRGWDRFVVHFEDGGRLALRDKRRLGRARLEPDLAAVGPDAAEITRDDFRARVGPRDRAAEGAPHGPERRRRASATCSPTRSSGAPAWIRAARPAG